MKKEIKIDSNNFFNRSGLTLEIRRNFTKNLDGLEYEKTEGIRLDEIDDLLDGGFGVYDYKEPVLVRWFNSTKSRQDLGKEETLKYLADKLANCHPDNIERVKAEMEAAKADQGKLLFDRILEVFKGHEHIELILE